MLSAIAQSNNLAAWDGARIRAFIKLVIEYAPQILPLILPLFGLASADDEKLTAMPEAELTAIDWKAMIALILQILALFNTPPAPGPIAN